MTITAAHDIKEGDKLCMDRNEHEQLVFRRADQPFDEAGAWAEESIPKGEQVLWSPSTGRVCIMPEALRDGKPRFGQ